MQIARCSAETDYSDGLLEALALNVPVVPSEHGRGPGGVITALPTAMTMLWIGALRRLMLPTTIGQFGRIRTAREPVTMPPRARRKWRTGSLRRLSAIEYWPAIESITSQEFYLNPVLGAGTSARRKQCLPCQQRYSGRHQKSGDPTAAIHFFMQEDFRSKGVTDEGE
jgi:hypothetical protein